MCCRFGVQCDSLEPREHLHVCTTGRGRYINKNRVSTRVEHLIVKSQQLGRWFLLIKPLHCDGEGRSTASFTDNLKCHHTWTLLSVAGVLVSSFCGLNTKKPHSLAEASHAQTTVERPWLHIGLLSSSLSKQKRRTCLLPPLPPSHRQQRVCDAQTPANADASCHRARFIGFHICTYWPREEEFNYTARVNMRVSVFMKISLRRHSNRRREIMYAVTSNLHTQI